MNEKRDRFLRMRELRLPKAVKGIQLLQAFSRGRDYEARRDERMEIVRELEQAVDVVRGAYGLPPAGSQPQQQMPLSEELPVSRVPVSSADKRDIKAAYQKIADGNVREGMLSLRKVILGWSPEDGT